MHLLLLGTQERFPPLLLFLAELWHEILERLREA